jgi:hypothetical protein
VRGLVAPEQWLKWSQAGPRRPAWPLGGGHGLSHGSQHRSGERWTAVLLGDSRARSRARRPRTAAAAAAPRATAPLNAAAAAAAAVANPQALAATYAVRALLSFFSRLDKELVAPFQPLLEDPDSLTPVRSSGLLDWIGLDWIGLDWIGDVARRGAAPPARARGGSWSLIE